VTALETKRATRANFFAGLMVVAGLPCTVMIVVYIHLLRARNPEVAPAVDALALMMMSLLAYALAALGCVCGLLYFGIVRFKRGSMPRRWQWGAITYSVTQLLVSVVYWMVGRPG
jgi:ACR3 family arsenite efflux pump ArsB